MLLSFALYRLNARVVVVVVTVVIVVVVAVLVAVAEFIDSCY